MANHILKKAIDKIGIDNKMFSDFVNQPSWSIANCLWNSHQVERLIFSHDFAKAFWGKQKINGLDKRNEDNKVYLTKSSKYEFENFYDGSLGAIYDWEIHLQLMILQDEPLKYLEKFL